MNLFIRNIGCLYTPRAADSEDIFRPVMDISDAAIFISKGRIKAIGREKEIAPHVPKGVPIFDAHQRVALPGFVDCHAHPVFAGERSNEFHKRNAGATYLQIAKEGGGIASSAQALAEASVETLIEQTLPRLKRFLLSGTTTLEA
ncbi:imidazolonepropionase, partial [bacterium]|nr:imidazolonepropionase [bacterium]